MANAVKGEVEVELSGKTFTLVYGWEALEAAEEAMDLPMRSILHLMAQNRLKATRVFVWAGLRLKHPEIRLDDMPALILGADREMLGAKIQEALVKGFPQLLGAAEPPSPKTANPDA